MAHVFDKLMLKLGYTTYMAHGGDWGSLITRYLGQHHATHCRAVHINNPLDVTPPFSKGMRCRIASHLLTRVTR
jgi:hypothetical protein